MTGLRRIALGLCCCVGAVGAVSCRKAAPPVVSELVVEQFSGGSVAGLSQEDFRRRLVAQLEAAGFVMSEGEHPPGAASPWILKAAASVGEPELEEASGPKVSFVLHLRQRGAVEGTEIVTSGVSPRSDDVEGVQLAARNTLEGVVLRASKEAKALIELEPAPEKDLVARVKDRDLAVRDAAVRLLVGHHNLAALPPLLERLKSSDLDEVRRAVGALVELKATQAVNAMIEATRHQGPVVEREIVFAVAAIGGDDAEAYLDLVASGDDDPVLRASAEAGLKELRARRNDAGAERR